MSKTFDNGTICASEQALVVEKYVAAQLEPFFKAEGAYYCSEWQAQKLGEIVYDRENRVMRAEVVGRSAEHLANLAGINVEKNTRMLIAPCSGIGPQFPLSHEILTPLLTYYVVDTYDQAIDYCVKLNQLGGQGHTVSIYTNREKVINDFIAKVSAGRICVNTPTTHGAIGGTFNTLNPSFTLSCGTEAGNIYTDNITTTHLHNIHRIARRRPNIRWFSIPEKTWLDPETTAEKIIMQYNKNY
jgi:acetaldehyde dehydrogenase/alcohol dehydrogenase